MVVGVGAEAVDGAVGLEAEGEVRALLLALREGGCRRRKAESAARERGQRAAARRGAGRRSAVRAARRRAGGAARRGAAAAAARGWNIMDINIRIPRG